jgi:glycosyltransferase involved in cell wall biosynthesis
MSPQLSVIIPTYNSADRIGTTIGHLVARCRLTTEIIVVSDASTDATAEVLTALVARHPGLTVIRHDTNHGAGAARNTGFARATGDYTLFLDDDDIVLDGAIDRLHAEAEQSGADLVIAPYMTAPDDRTEPGPMHNDDRRFWDSVMTESSRRTFAPTENPGVLKTTNYPWNKLCRTAYLRRIGLRFSTTPVHNDIFAHWQMLMNCQSYHVSDIPVCIHIVSPQGSNITNIWDERRLAMFQVLDELNAYFDENPVLRERYYSIFLSFCVTLLDWARNRTPAAQRPGLAAGITRFLTDLTVRDYVRLSRSDRPAADRLVRMKFDTHDFARIGAA